MKIGYSGIRPEWFYGGEEGKTKLNWFLYEFALDYHSAIMGSGALKAYRGSHSRENIARFCAYFAQRMEESVLDRLAGRTDATVIDEDYIADFYPKMPGATTRRLLDAACLAWDGLLSVCEACPSRCLSEKERKSEYFDRYKDELF